jgi:23S rRNA C2498 (ribose-2'-O)-methylase RlmM
VREFDVFVPLFHNDGSAINTRLFQQLQERRLAEFDGLTFFPQPNKGFWTITDKPRKARRFLSRLKKWLKATFQQEDILIVERKVGLIP